MPAHSIEDYFRSHRSQAAKCNERGLISSLFPEIAGYLDQGYTKRMIWGFLCERGDVAVTYRTFCKWISEMESRRLTVEEAKNESANAAQETPSDEWEPIRPPEVQFKTFEVTTMNADPESYFVK